MTRNEIVNDALRYQAEVGKLVGKIENGPHYEAMECYALASEFYLVVQSLLKLASAVSNNPLMETKQ